MIILPRFDSPRYVVKRNYSLDGEYYSAYDLETKRFASFIHEGVTSLYVFDSINKTQAYCNELDTEDALYTVALIEFTTGKEYPFNQFT